MKREVVLTSPDGNRVVWATLRGEQDESRDRDQVLRARDWARRMYGQTSEAVDTVRIETKAKTT